MSLLPFIFFLLTCAVLQVAQSRANDAKKNVGIIGGHEIPIEDAPYMAGFIRNRVLVCAGTIIHRQFILTSASCAKNWYPIRHAHVGSNRVWRGGSFLAVSDMLCHEEYNKHTFANNICLLKLREPIVFTSPKIGIVNLPEENIDVGAGNLMDVTGWGSTDTVGSQYPEYLQRARIVVYPDSLCKAYAPNNMTADMMCAGAQGRDACYGDIGGPLTQNNVQYGIVGCGPPRCGFMPTTYIKVSKYVSWIRNTISHNS